MPMYFLPFCTAHRPVVPDPKNGSRIIASGLVVLIIGSISVIGKVAKCAPLNGLVGIVQTERRLRVADVFSC